MPLHAVVSLRDHSRKVDRIAAALRTHPGGRPVSLQKRATRHEVPRPRDLRRADDKIDVSDLNGILEIDTSARTCTAEPGVTFVDLVKATLPHGLVPFVVPELKTITIGGAVSGCSIESMSFRTGGFHDSCLEYEVVTSDGEVISCDPDGERRLVFEMMHGSFGTLGVLTKLRFRLAPAGPFVHVVNERHAALESYAAAIGSHARTGDLDFMDGIIHRPDLHALCVGRFADEAPYAHRYDWVVPYYQTTARRDEDWFRTPDYFFRYDRGVTNVHPKSLPARILFGKLLHSSTVLRLAEKLPWLVSADKPTVTVDLFLPFSKFGAFMDWYWREFGVHPLWCVPYRPAKRYAWLSDEWYAGVRDEMFVDLAIYGFTQRGDRNWYRLIEEKLAELNGVKTLISFNYYGEDEFWRIFHRENHFAVKAVTDRRGLFRDLYAKTCCAPLGIG